MGRKADLRRVDAVIAEFGMTPEQGFEFRDYLHQCKTSGYFGTANSRGDFTLDEMRVLAAEFLAPEEGQ